MKPYSGNEPADMLYEKGGGVRFERNPSILSMRTKAELVDYVEAIFEREGSAAQLGTDKAQLRAFICEVARHYRENPYHNFHHAVDTVNTMAWMLDRPVLRSHLPVHLHFLLLLVALVHDVEHPGHNNQYEVGIGSPLALKYDNVAVLENHSLDVTLQILDLPEYNLFAHQDPETVREWRRIVGDQILATDFAMHRTFLDGFSAYLADHKPDFADPTFLTWITRALIKGADIANTTKPFDDAKVWGRRVMLEAWAQGIEEKKRNLPVGGFNDPEKVQLNAVQAGFIKLAAMELFDLLRSVAPGLDEMANNLAKNLEIYEDLANRGETLFE